MAIVITTVKRRSTFAVNYQEILLSIAVIFYISLIILNFLFFFHENYVSKDSAQGIAKSYQPQNQGGEGGTNTVPLGAKCLDPTSIK